jgi:hypothetical protein
MRWGQLSEASSPLATLKPEEDYLISFENPMTNSYIINLSLSDKSTVSLKLMDIGGKVMTPLIDENLDEGQYLLEVDYLRSGLFRRKAKAICFCLLLFIHQANLSILFQLENFI